MVGPHHSFQLLVVEQFVAAARAVALPTLEGLFDFLVGRQEDEVSVDVAGIVDFPGIVVAAGVQEGDVVGIGVEADIDLFGVDVAIVNVAFDSQSFAEGIGGEVVHPVEVLLGHQVEEHRGSVPAEEEEPHEFEVDVEEVVEIFAFLFLTLADGTGTLITPSLKLASQLVHVPGCEFAAILATHRAQRETPQLHIHHSLLAQPVLALPLLIIPFVFQFFCPSTQAAAMGEDTGLGKVQYFCLDGGFVAVDVGLVLEVLLQA